MRKLGIFILIFLVFSCKFKDYKYKITCVNTMYYTNNVIYNGSKIYYLNSNGDTIVMSNNYGFDCKIDTLKK